MKVIYRSYILLWCVLFLFLLSLSACNLIKFFDGPTDLKDLLVGTTFPKIEELVEEENQAIPDSPEIPGDPGSSGVYMDIEEDPANPSALGQGMANNPGGLPLKPVGFINFGTINATVQPWTYIPLGSQEYLSPVGASTVVSAQGSGGNSPNSSAYLSLPMGTYTWCIDWEDEDKDGDGYFDYYHYIETATTMLDENDSDELDFAEIVNIRTPPETAFVSAGKCGRPQADEDCIGKSTYFKSFVGNVGMEPIYPLDVIAYANTAYRSSPDGINISASNPENYYYVNIILAGSGSWIEATTNDPYKAMGVQIFGDQTIGWARILFDGLVMWEGDTSSAVIDPNENSGLGWYGLYVEAVCVPPGSHTIRVESGPVKEGVGGWQGGVPVELFGYRW